MNITQTKPTAIVKIPAIDPRVLGAIFGAKSPDQIIRKVKDSLTLYGERHGEFPRIRELARVQGYSVGFKHSPMPWLHPIRLGRQEIVVAEINNNRQQGPLVTLTPIN